MFAAVALCAVSVTGVVGQEAEARAAVDQIFVGRPWTVGSTLSAVTKGAATSVFTT